MGRVINGFKKVGGFVKGLGRTAKWTLRGAVVGAMLGNVSGGYTADYLATRNSLREGARAVLTEQARKEAIKNAGKMDKIKFYTGLKNLSEEQLAKVKAESNRYGSMGRTIKNMPKSPKVNFNKSGIAGTVSGAASGAAVAGGSAAALAALAALKRKRAQRRNP